MAAVAPTSPTSVGGSARPKLAPTNGLERDFAVRNGPTGRAGEDGHLKAGDESPARRIRR